MSKKKSAAPFTMAQLHLLKEQGKIQGFDVPCETVVSKKKRSKFGNKTTEVDGIKFDSNKEARRYKDLVMLQKIGEIGMLKLQQPFHLTDCKYIADFTYIVVSTGEFVVEDVKSEITRQLPVYRLKKKMMYSIHNIKIKET